MPHRTPATMTVTVALDPEGLTVTAAPPETLSQLNVEHVTGVPVRAFLEAIRAPGFPLDVAKLGKLRIVHRAEFVRWLLAQTAKDLHAPDHGPANDAAPADPTVDEVLAELGLERVAAPAKRARGSR